MIQFQEQDGRLVFTVRVVARASRSSVIGEHGGQLRVRIAAPPVDGAANEELVRVLARALGLPTRDVEITSGHSSKIKRVRATGATGEQLEMLARGEFQGS